jgi:hypothetical protein
MAEASELEVAQQRLRRLERRLELLLLGGTEHGLKDPSAEALLGEICRQRTALEKIEENNDGRRQDQDRQA